MNPSLLQLMHAIGERCFGKRHLASPDGYENISRRTEY